MRKWPFVLARRLSRWRARRSARSSVPQRPNWSRLSSDRGNKTGRTRVAELFLKPVLALSERTGVFQVGGRVPGDNIRTGQRVRARRELPGAQLIGWQGERAGDDVRDACQSACMPVCLPACGADGCRALRKEGVGPQARGEWGGADGARAHSGVG